MPLLGAQLALHGNHPLTDARVHADPGSGGGHIGLADALGDLDVVQKNAVAQRRREQPDAGPRRQPAQLFPIVEVAVGLNGLEREGAIHGAGLQVQQSEAGGDARRDRALAGAGRAVDGDHQRRAVVGGHTPGFFLAGLRPRKLAGGLPGFPPGFPRSRARSWPGSGRPGSGRPGPGAKDPASCPGRGLRRILHSRPAAADRCGLDCGLDCALTAAVDCGRSTGHLRPRGRARSGEPPGPTAGRPPTRGSTAAWGPAGGPGTIASRGRRRCRRTARRTTRRPRSDRALAASCPSSPDRSRGFCAGRPGESPRLPGFGWTGRRRCPRPVRAQGAAGPRFCPPVHVARWFARARLAARVRPPTRARNSVPASRLSAGLAGPRSRLTGPAAAGRHCAAGRRGPLRSLALTAGLAGLGGRPGRKAGAEAGRIGRAPGSFLCTGAGRVTGRRGLSILATAPAGGLIGSALMAGGAAGSANSGKPASRK